MKKTARKRRRMQRQLKVATKMVRESGGGRESVSLWGCEPLVHVLALRVQDRRRPWVLARDTLEARTQQ